MKNPFRGLLHVSEALVQTGKLMGELKRLRHIVQDVQAHNWPGAVADAQPYLTCALEDLRKHHASVGHAIDNVVEALAEGDGDK